MLSKDAKLNILAILATSDEEVVKMAGLFSGLKRWVRRKLHAPGFHPDMVATLNKITWHSEEAEKAIYANDIKAYLFHLDNLKSSCSELLKNKPTSPEVLKEEVKPELKIEPKSEEKIEVKEPPAPIKEDKPASYREPAPKEPEVQKSEGPSLKDQEVVFGKNALKIKEKIKKVVTDSGLDYNLSSLGKDQSLLKFWFVNAIKDGETHFLTDTVAEVNFTTKVPGISDIDFYFTVTLKKIRNQWEIYDLDGSTKKVARLQRLMKLAGNQRPLKYVKLSEQDFAEVLRRGYKLAFGKEPSLPTLAAGWAQGTIEAGRPPKLPCNNVGNIKVYDTKVPYFVMDTFEFDKNGKRFDDKGAKWRAFDSPEEGAAFYWKYLKANYGSAFTEMQEGDSRGASVELGKNHYYTANIDKYSSATQSNYDYFMKNLASKFKNLDTSKPPATQTSIPANDVQPTEELTDKLFRAAGTVTTLVKKAALRTLPETSVLIRAAKTIDNYQGLQALGRLSTDFFSSSHRLEETPEFLHLKIKCRGSSENVELAHIALLESIQVIKPVEASIMVGL